MYLGIRVHEEEELVQRRVIHGALAQLEWRARVVVDVIQAHLIADFNSAL